MPLNRIPPSEVALAVTDTTFRVCQASSWFGLRKPPAIGEGHFKADNSADCAPVLSWRTPGQHDVLDSPEVGEHLLHAFGAPDRLATVES